MAATNKFILQISGSRITLESGAVSERLKNGQIAIETSSSITHMAYREVTASPDGSYDGAYHTVANLSDAVGDNLGNHIATRNLDMGSYWMSPDGTSSGVQIGTSGVLVQQSTTFARVNFIDSNVTIYRSTNTLYMVTNVGDFNITGVAGSTLNLRCGCASVALSNGSGIVGITTNINQPISFSSSGGTSTISLTTSGRYAEVNLSTSNEYGAINITTTQTTSNITLRANSSNINLTANNVYFTNLTGGGNSPAYLDSTGRIYRGP
jgi:hypothetical protein